MVVKLETVATLYADAYPTLAKSRGREDCSPTARRQKKIALPALVEDDSEDSFEPEPRVHIMTTEALRRQKSVSPQRRERLIKRLALPSLSEDEEP